MRPEGQAPTPPVGTNQPTVFSTVGLPSARRVELWETHNANALIGLDVRASAPLEATELNVQLARVHLARVTGSAHAVRRTANVIERSPADAIAVYRTLRGTASFTSADGTRSLRPGNALICDADLPFDREFARGLEELVIKVPRPAFARTTGAASLRGPVVATFGGAAGANPYAHALARAAARATRPEGRLPADEGTVLDLIAMLACGRDTARATAHRAAARSYIEEHLTDPKLGAEQVAAAIGISERQLSRVFAADGTSVPRHILTRRLQLAYSILSNGRGSVADVAARCGFTSVTYFSHAFRTHFGERASDVRRAP